MRFCARPTFGHWTGCINVLVNYLIVVKGEILLIDYESLGIGQVIENLRRRRRLTQEQLAEKADFDRKTLSNIERDKAVPSFATILNIALALDMTLAEFSKEIEKHTKILDYYEDKK